MCRKQTGVSIGKLCERCDGKCVICDSYVRPQVVVRICDECNYGSHQGRCVICGAPGSSEAYYCKECVQQEKDVRILVCLPLSFISLLIFQTFALQRDGCPKVVNLGVAKTDRYFENKKYGGAR